MPSSSPSTAGPQASTFGLKGLICVGTGGLGVISGFALFFLILVEGDEPLKFFLIFGVATGLSLIIEFLREVIDPAHESAGPPRSLWAGVFVSLVIVGLSELFALASHSVISIYGGPDFSATVEILLGGALSAAHASNHELVWLIGVWMASGMALAGGLSRGIGRSDGPLAARIRSSAVRGALWGAVVAPAILLLYLLVIDTAQALGVFVNHPDIWRHNLHALEDTIVQLSGIARPVASAIFWVVNHAIFLLGEDTVGPLLIVAAMIGGSIWAIRRDGGAFWWVVLVLAIAMVMAPMLPSIGSITLLLIRTGMIWALPGAAIGGLVPLLERPSAARRWWSVVAFTAAGVLIVLTMARLEGRWWLLLPAAGIVAAGYFVWQTGRVEACWPVLAVSVATIVCGLTMAMQTFATFGGVLNNLYDLGHLPDRLAGVLPPPVHKPPPDAFEEVARLAGAHATQLNKAIAEGMGAATANAGRMELVDVALASHYLDDLAAKVEPLPPDDQPGARELADLRAEVDSLEPVSAGPASAGQFTSRLQRIIDVQTRVRALETNVRRKLATVHTFATSLDAIRRPYDNDAVKALKDRDPASLDKLEAGEQYVLSRSQPLLDLLDRRRQSLEHLLGSVDASGSVLACKADAARIANEAYTLVCSWLELGLAGSFGFWATLGLLAGWAIERRRVERLGQTAASASHV